MPKKKHEQRKQGSGQLRRSQPATAAPVVPEPRVAPEPSGPVILTLPSEENPVLRLEIAAEATLEQRELARRYWMPALDGGWAELVADLGWVGQIAHGLKEVCTAYLLSALCRSCQSPLSVTSRNDAITIGGHYLRHPKRKRMPWTECGACKESRTNRLEREQRAAVPVEVRHPAERQEVDDRGRDHVADGRAAGDVHHGLVLDDVRDAHGARRVGARRLHAAPMRARPHRDHRRGAPARFLENLFGRPAADGRVDPVLLQRHGSRDHQEVLAAVRLHRLLARPLGLRGRTHRRRRRRRTHAVGDLFQLE